MTPSRVYQIIILILLIAVIVLSWLLIRETRQNHALESEVLKTKAKLRSIDVRLTSLTEKYTADSIQTAQDTQLKREAISVTKAKSNALRPRIAQDSVTQAFVASQDLEIQQLGGLNASIELGYQSQLKTLKDVIVLEKMKGAKQSVLIDKQVELLKQKEREKRKERSAKVTFRTILGLGVVGTVILLSQ